MARQRINTQNSGNPISQTRIINGVEVNPACPDCKYPFMVSIKSNQHFCGGVLIDERWVLTAAHCANNISPNTRFELGLHNVNYTTGRQTYYSNYDVIMHPDYENYYDNDYALVYLNEPVSSIFTPINLITYPTYDDGGVIGTIMGWGETEWGIASEVLMEVDLMVDDSCGDWPDEYITDNHICFDTGIPEGTIFDCGHPDACNYNPDTTFDDGSCIFYIDCNCPNEQEQAGLSCISDTTGEEVPGGWCCESTDYCVNGSGTNQNSCNNVCDEPCIPRCQHAGYGAGCGIPGDWGVCLGDFICEEDIPNDYEADGYPGSGACSGDSGGPAIITNPNDGSYELVGITSWGPQGCQEPNYPSVYAKIWPQKDWILNTISNPPDDYDVDPYIPGEPLDIEYNHGNFIDQNDTVLDLPLQVRGNDAIIQNWFDGMTTLTLRQLLGKEIYITLDNPG